ncbi:hypothetical protein J437_LFUL008875, partial [Ladona fulva]
MSRWKDIPKLTYSNKDLNFKLYEESESKLDSFLRYTWEKAHDYGVFRYKLKIQASKELPGKYSFVAQASLNEDRATKRREPQVIQKIGEPFNPNLFNFTLLKKEEILFQLRCEEGQHESDYIAINASPLEYGNCLLLPCLEECHPQIVKEYGLKFAVKFLLLSGSYDMRVGFNGLCAFASVNHQHYHGYYLKTRMLLERIAVHHLSGPCYTLLDFASKGFVFQLLGEDVDGLVRNVYKLANYFQTKNIAHNLFMTRGWTFERSSELESTSSAYYTVRVYVWGRKPSHGYKKVDAFNPALCELFGHLPTKKREIYDELTEEYVVDILHEITHEVFVSVKEEVRMLFSEDTYEEPKS